MRHVCLIGAGSIASAHAAAIKAIPGVRLYGVQDPDEAAASRLAKAWSIPRRYATADDVLADGIVDCVHVLTPPDRHRCAAIPFLEAGVAALVETPLAANLGECEELLSAAERGRTIVGVNHNFVHHPAFRRLVDATLQRRLGPPRFVSCVANLALPQLAAGRFSHWMFSEPVNILLEQAVHPLSQIATLAGTLEQLQASAGKPMEIAPGVPFFPAVSMTLKGDRLPAQLRLAVGQSFPFWQISVICDDGVAVADILANRFFTMERTRHRDVADACLSGLATAGAIAGASLRLARRPDPFLDSVRGSAAAFHDALDRRRPPELDGTFGSHLVAVCEQVARQAFFPTEARPRPVRSQGTADVAVLGGTGFIGRHVVRRLLAEGMRVAVMARHTANLPAEFHDDRVVVTPGDARDPDAVARIVEAGRLVVNLAHGGGGNDWHAVRDAMVGSATIPARACLAAGSARLVHVGSIASLYLGRRSEVVTGTTPPDPKPTTRGDYARAKAECDRLLAAMRAEQGLPLVILRPGLVVGEGGSPFHRGLGDFNCDQHCNGWNSGTNPLPFVLVDDVADAVWQALTQPAALGRTYNLVGDVRLSAREYIAELAAVLERPLRFHPGQPSLRWAEEWLKWAAKTVSGRRAPPPSRRDLLSRGLVATFFCADAKADLGWRPEADRERFIEKALRVHRGELGRV